MERKRSILLIGITLLAFLLLSTPAFPINISGYSDIGLGIESPLGSGSTQAGSGELGNFIYITFISDTPISLTEATYNFTGKDVEWDGDIHFVPTQKSPGLNFSTFPTTFPTPVQVFGFTATGFNSGDFLFYGLNLDKPSIGHTGSPVGSDYVGGVITVGFNDGQTAVGTFAAFDPSVPLSFGNARATFSISEGPEPVPEPSTMLLLSSGIVGMVPFIRRKLKK